MKTCSACKKSKTLEEFNKNRACKDGLDNQCTICARISKAKWKKANVNKTLEQQRRHYARNPSKGRARTKQWRLDNPSKAAMQCSKRFKSIQQRTPKWLTELDFTHMDIFYNSAKALTKELNIKFEVDHIIPLRGKYISGLHVPSNLQVISSTDNQKKGAR